MNNWYDDSDTTAIIKRNGIILMSVVSLVCLCLFALLITRLAGLWPEWLIRLELIVKGVL